jgi:hypothetical protein
MAAIRRNPGITVFVCLSLTAALVAWLAWPSPAPAWAGSGYTALDAVTADRIAVLRQDVGLDDDALACADLSAAQLEGTLAALRTWYAAEQADWLAASAAVADRRAVIRRLESAIANGQAEASALNAARQELTQAQAAYETLLAGLRTAATAGLSDSQRTVLNQMRTHRAVCMPFRILDISAEQQAGLARVLADYHQRLALVRNASAQAALAAEHAQAVADAIGADNVTLLAALAAYRGAAAERVVAALHLVLPVENGA